MMIENSWADKVPVPNNKGELTVTVIGAGAGLELFGICLFYNEVQTRLKRLHVNFIDIISEWQTTRSNIIENLIRLKFPNVRIYSKNIPLDLAKHGVEALAKEDSSIVCSQIVIIYNVLNEIKPTEKNLKHLIRNLRYIVMQCENPLLVLMAEPTAAKALPRIKPVVEWFCSSTESLLDEPYAEISFASEPTLIAFEGTGNGLNDRLYSEFGEQAKPTLSRLLRRYMRAFLFNGASLPKAKKFEQLAKQQLERYPQGQFKPVRSMKGSFAMVDPNWDDFTSQPIKKAAPLGV